MADSGVALTFDERRPTSLRELLACPRRTDLYPDPRAGHPPVGTVERGHLPDHLLQ